MAEASFVQQENQVCPFFSNAKCRYGDRCRFKHISSGKRSNQECRYYQEGRCTFGDRCWFRHGPAENTAAPVAPTPQNRHATRSSSLQTGNVEPMSPSKSDSSRRETQHNPSRFANPSNKKVVDRDLSKRNQPLNWVNAPEFVPRTMKSYADTLRPKEQFAHNVPDLCYDFMNGRCLEGEFCQFAHGDSCDICGRPVLNPYDPDQQKEHMEVCEKELERDMEYSFAVQRSEDKACGICMDIIMEKEHFAERRFGILENCNHIFCFSCIMKWRKTKSHDIEIALDSTLTKSCPECRVPSNFITPSYYWFETEEDKKKLVADYKTSLGKKPCKFFKQGQGECPFGGLCYYLHALPNGKKVTLPPPQRRARVNDSGELDIMSRIMLLDFFSARESLSLDELLFATSESLDDDDEISFSSDAEFSLESLEI